MFRTPKENIGYREQAVIYYPCFVVAWVGCVLVGRCGGHDGGGEGGGRQGGGEHKWIARVGCVGVCSADGQQSHSLRPGKILAACQKWFKDSGPQIS